MSQKEFQRVKVIESATGGKWAYALLPVGCSWPSARCSGLNAAINPIPWLGCSTAIATCPGRFRFPGAVDLDLGPGQVSGLQRFSSGRKNYAMRKTSRSAARPCAASAPHVRQSIAG